MEDRPGANVGQSAPDFELPDADGRPVRLSDFRGKAEVVLFFYPKDDTPGCSAEACSFRDSFEEFRTAGVEVLGVSNDSETSHRGFAARLKLPYRLLSDRDGAVRSLYRVPKTLGLIPGRVTYLIDREGLVRHIYSSQLRPRAHVAEALRGLRELVWKPIDLDPGPWS